MWRTGTFFWSALLLHFFRRPQINNASNLFLDCLFLFNTQAYGSTLRVSDQSLTEHLIWNVYCCRRLSGVIWENLKHKIWSQFLNIYLRIKMSSTISKLEIGSRIKSSIVMIDTQTDSIQCLNLAKYWFNSIFDSILLFENSIQ